VIERLGELERAGGRLLTFGEWAWRVIGAVVCHQRVERAARLTHQYRQRNLFTELRFYILLNETYIVLEMPFPGNLLVV